MVVVVPARGAVVGKAEGNALAVAEEKGPPHDGRPGVAGEVAEARRHQGLVAHVEFDDAVERLVRLPETVHPCMAAAGIGHQPGAGRCAFVQRAGDVRPGPRAVPAAEFRRDRPLGRNRRPLADQVDGGRRRAQPVHDAGGAAHQLDPVVGRRVVQERAHRGRSRHPVDLVVLQIGAARIDGGAVLPEGGVLQDDAGRRFQRIGHRGQVLVVQPLAGQHRDRLRRFLRRQVQAGGTAGGGRGVRARALRGGPGGLAGHRDFGQRRPGGAVAAFAGQGGLCTLQGPDGQRSVPGPGELKAAVGQCFLRGLLGGVVPVNRGRRVAVHQR